MVNYDNLKILWVTKLKKDREKFSFYLIYLFLKFIYLVIFVLTCLVFIIRNPCKIQSKVASESVYKIKYNPDYGY